jgi:hypothetical protein
MREVVENWREGVSDMCLAETVIDVDH